MKFYGAAGPYVSIALDGNTKSETFEPKEPSSVKSDIKWGANDEVNSFSRADYGLQFNLGAELKSFQMGVSYGLGLHGISVFNDANATNIKNRVWSFYVGYTFPSKEQT